MKKKIVILSVTLFCCLSVINAQETKSSDDNTEKKKLKLENLFTGGSASLYFSTYTTVMGLNPHFGYSLNKWLDVAASFNVNYISQKDYEQLGDKARQIVYAPGVFVRAFPVSMVFAQAQYEHNFITQKYYDPYGGEYKSKYDVNSLLVGIGYASDREKGENDYYYLSVMIDVLGNPGSPYLDGYGRNFPIVKAGYNIALFQEKHRHHHKRY